MPSEWEAGDGCGLGIGGFSNAGNRGWSLGGEQGVGSLASDGSRGCSTTGGGGYIYLDGGASGGYSYHNEVQADSVRDLLVHYVYTAWGRWSGTP